MPGPNLTPWLRDLQLGGHRAHRPGVFASRLDLHGWPGRRSLRGHRGCVNAIDFSTSGFLLASGGDDKKVAVWVLTACLTSGTTEVTASVMDGEHKSNIFCLSFSHDVASTLYSGGNDEVVLKTDVATGKKVATFVHEDSVFGVDCSPLCPDVFASASSEGKVRLYDTRSPESDPTVLAEQFDPYHSVHFNPVEPRLVVTSNSRSGVELWDLRRPKLPAMMYGIGTTRTAMSAEFSRDGTKIFSMRRRMPPCLFLTSSPNLQVEFDHPGYFNACTMKKGCFAGPGDEWVMAGSDDFGVYAWKIPDLTPDEEVWVEEADHVLRGHQSIVNQVRYERNLHMVASSGVEKAVRLWGSLNFPAESDADGGANAEEAVRRIYSRRDYMRLVSHSPDEPSMTSTEENPRMLAFFDSLVQRDLDDSSNSSTGFSSENRGGSDDSSTSSSSADLVPDGGHVDHQQRPKISEVIRKRRRPAMKRHLLRKQRRVRSSMQERAACVKAMSVIVMDGSEDGDSEDDELSKSLPAKEKSPVTPDLLRTPPSADTSFERQEREIMVALRETRPTEDDEGSEDEEEDRSRSREVIRERLAEAERSLAQQQQRAEASNNDNGEGGASTSGVTKRSVRSTARRYRTRERTGEDSNSE